jgi:hypothetical protein
MAPDPASKTQYPVVIDYDRYRYRAVIERRAAIAAFPGKIAGFAGRHAAGVHSTLRSFRATAGAWLSTSRFAG